MGLNEEARGVKERNRWKEKKDKEVCVCKLIIIIFFRPLLSLVL